MKKVDLIYSNWITAPTGASHFVGKMKQMKDIFASQGIDLRVISPDLFHPRQFADEVTKSSFRVRLAYSLSKYSAIVTRFVLYMGYDRAAKRILDYYDTLPDKGDLLAFQETITCYHYLKRHRIHKQKVLLTIHNNGDIWEMWYYSFPKLKSILLNSYRKSLEITLLNGCDKIGFVADFPRKSFCEHYSYDVNKTYFVYTSIEEKERPEPMLIGDKVKFITSGTLGIRKNQLGVLKAISILPKEYQSQISYTILSNGEMREKLEKEAINLYADINFTGKVQNVDDYLKQANCFVLYSKDEGQPMSIVEAMRAGLPIIGSNIAGIPEQIKDGETGFCIDLDERHLAGKLKFIIDNKDILPTMGKASYEYFLEKFTINAMVKKYAEIYKKTINENL